ncbi:MAG TPA: molybdate ABC transporter substrate-binding protein [Thermoanaerobaculia bacterium]
MALLAAALPAVDAGASMAAENREIRIAAAADLKFALDALIEAFRAAHPEITVKASFGSSGIFYSQLSSGAPFDLFFSADAEYPRRLVAEGAGLAGSEFLYAIGRIVLWVPRSSPIDVEDLGIRALRHASVRHIAIANPRHAPYGRAAEAAMRRLQVYDSVKDKLVLGENIAQTAQFVESGSAEIGILALSLAVAPAMKDSGRFWEIPPDSYPRIEQAGIILKASRDADAARLFRGLVTGAEGRSILKRFGFSFAEE